MKIVREPLLHFLLLGCVLVIIHGLLDEGRWSAADEIVVDQRRIDALSTQFEMVWQRPPSTDELKTLIRSWIREEVLYREGLANGLDRNDSVIRRRVAQNMELLGSAFLPGMPSDEELQSWFHANTGNYLTPTRYSFSQVYFDPDRDAADLAKRLVAARQQLRSGEKPLAADPTLLPLKVTDATVPQVTSVFGKKFATALEKITPGDWVGPVESGYGMHLVLVEQITPGGLPGLPDIQSTVEVDYRYIQSVRASDDFYRALRNRYTLKIEAGPVAMRDL